MTIWVPTQEDYDAHFKNLLQTITCKGQPVTVKYYMPEHQLQPDADLIKPAIAFYQYDKVHDTSREQSYTTNTVATTPTTVTTQQDPIPVKLFYQFHIISDYKEHENEILRQFDKLFPFRGYISMTSPDGEVQTYDFFQRDFINADTYQVKNKDYNTQVNETIGRLFRKIYKFQLLTELDIYPPSTYTKVTTVVPPVTTVTP